MIAGRGWKVRRGGGGGRRGMRRGWFGDAQVGRGIETGSGAC